MSKECNHDCSHCKENCNERKASKKDFLLDSHEGSKIKKVIGIVSGKGGVGKSLVTSMLATQANKNGLKVGIMDADITGPSIPKSFGLSKKLEIDKTGIKPSVTENGIKIVSTNLLLENETDPVIWRGPIIANTVRQFWTDVIWGDIDIMFIDMPPGTGDVPLTVFQSIPIDGIIVVTSPQELVSMIVTKAVKMAESMEVPIIGLIENMSYFECPDNHKKYNIFGESHIQEIAKSYNLEVLANLPIDPKIATLCDEGKIEKYENDFFTKTLDKIKNMEVM